MAVESLIEQVRAHDLTLGETYTFEVCHQPLAEHRYEKGKLMARGEKVYIETQKGFWEPLGISATNVRGEDKPILNLEGFTFHTTLPEDAE